MTEKARLYRVEVTLPFYMWAEGDDDLHMRLASAASDALSDSMGPEYDAAEVDLSYQERELLRAKMEEWDGGVPYGNAPDRYDGKTVEQVLAMAREEAEAAPEPPCPDCGRTGGCPHTTGQMILPGADVPINGKGDSEP